MKQEKWRNVLSAEREKLLGRIRNPKAEMVFVIFAGRLCGARKMEIDNVKKAGFILTIIIYFFLPAIVSSIWYLLGHETVDTLWAGTLAFLWMLIGVRIQNEINGVQEK